MADEAYGHGWRTRNNGLIEEQLATIFMEGLKDPSLKRTIYKKGVKTIEEATKIAKAEDRSKQRFPGEFQGNRREEMMEADRPRRSNHSDRRVLPMEIDHHRRGGCFRCGGQHRAKDCRTDVPNRRRVNALQVTPREYERERIAEEDRRLRRCFRCHKVGHQIRECMNRLN